jgi:hypothetical protein
MHHIYIYFYIGIYIYLTIVHALTMPSPSPPLFCLPILLPPKHVAAVMSGEPYAQCNVGSNISVMPHITLLDDVTTLTTVEHIAGADTRSSHMVCSQGGWFTLYFDDQPPKRVFMIYCLERVKVETVCYCHC